MSPSQLPEKARNFAIQAHKNQQYGEHPYSYHLDAVASIAKPYGDLAETVAYLHDVVEDTDVDLRAIEKSFGSFVAQCVDILTDEEGATRKEKKQKTYAKMAQVSGKLELALTVKAADRLANVREGAKNAMYKKEQEQFHSAVFREGLCDEIFKEIALILDKK